MSKNNFSIISFSFVISFIVSQNMGLDAKPPLHTMYVILDEGEFSLESEESLQEKVQNKYFLKCFKRNGIKRLPSSISFSPNGTCVAAFFKNQAVTVILKQEEDSFTLCAYHVPNYQHYQIIKILNLSPFIMYLLHDKQNKKYIFHLYDLRTKTKVLLRDAENTDYYVDDLSRRFSLKRLKLKFNKQAEEIIFSRNNESISIPLNDYVSYSAGDLGIIVEDQEIPAIIRSLV